MSEELCATMSDEIDLDAQRGPWREKPLATPSLTPRRPK
jgi:hypothetical protein